MKLRNTTPEQRAKLASLGFVRVDGLICNDPIRPNDRRQKLMAVDGQLGRYDSNNGRVVVVSEGGEVWLAFHPGTSDFWDRFQPVTGELCPKGQGAFVPCSNGESLSWHDTMERLANPDWQPKD